MAEQVGEIYYTVDMDTQPLVNKVDVADRELDKLQGTLKKTDKAAGQTNDGMGKLGSQMNKTAGQTSSFTFKMSGLATAIAGAITIDTLTRWQQLGEQFTLYQARITRLSAGTDQAADSYRALLAISSKTGAGMGDTVQLWESLTNTLRELGQSGAQVLTLTETLQKIGTIGGSSTEEMSNALRQLGQSLAGGVVRAEEFNAIIESMPELARQIAQGLGIPFNELRQQMLNGELTAERVLQAIEAQTAKVNSEFDKLPRKVGQAANAITNEFGAALSVLDKATGASNLLAKALDAVAKGIRLTAGNLTDQERLNELFNERAKLQDNINSREALGVGWTKKNQTDKERVLEIEKQLLELQNKRIAELKAQSAGETAKPEAAAATTSEDGQKALETLREQAALARVVGVERAKLAAVQRLGAGATDEERAQAEALAVEMYQLSEAQKVTKVSTKDLAAEQKKTAEQIEANKLVIADLTEQLYQSKLGAEDLAARQAELRLNQYATPEQINSVKALAAELQKAEDLKNRQRAIGADPGGFIKGDVKPLSGGAFDDQSARYEAEAAAEDVRYADQLVRLQEAKEAQLQVVGGYQALEEQLAAEHADRLVQIEQARTSVMLQAGQQLFDGLANATAQFAGEQSALYKVMLAASKAFAIADAAVKIQQGIAAAAATPWPANIAAMASVAAATGSIISTIGSVTMGGGRLNGGPVQSNNMYRINENGAPEVFNAANGRQYMLPNTRGEVVSNADATGDEGVMPTVIVNVENNGSGTTASATSRTEDRKVIIDVVVSDIMSGGRIATTVNQITGTRRAGG